MVSGYARGDDGRKVDVDEALVDQLIEKRVAFREMKNFADADAIQEQLAAMGVTLRDKELTWVADGVKRKPKRGLADQPLRSSQAKRRSGWKGVGGDS